MVLKKDCVRDLLKYFEKNLSYEIDIQVNNIEIKKYSYQDILYTCDKLYEAGFINAIRTYSICSRYPTIIVQSITYSGHEFLDNIRDNQIWKETKNKMKEIGGFSIAVMGQVAASIISSKLGI